MRTLALLFVTFTLLAVVRPAAMQEDIRFEERTLTHDGRERRYLLYVPPGYDPTEAVPLVFLLHGGGGSPDIYEGVTGMGEVARAAGFILVYPAGSGRFGSRRLLTWNAGHCCAYALENEIDDVGFFRDMVAELTAEFSIDPDRIYAAGHSNGAMMSSRLAAEMSGVFAAVGIVAGTIGGYPTPESDDLFIIPQPENPVSILHIHGMADGNVAYYGGVNSVEALDRRNDLSVAESIAFWVEANQCDPEPETVASDDGMVITDTYTCAATGTIVKLITIVDGGHAWPGGEGGSRRSDEPSDRVSATNEIWAFFSEN
jgi:polyhydroxybutyrate depolymerase